MDLTASKAGVACPSPLLQAPALTRCPVFSLLGQGLKCSIIAEHRSRDCHLYSLKCIACISESVEQKDGEFQLQEVVSIFEASGITPGRLCQGSLLQQTPRNPGLRQLMELLIKPFPQLDLAVFSQAPSCTLRTANRSPGWAQ